MAFLLFFSLLLSQVSTDNYLKWWFKRQAAKRCMNERNWQESAAWVELFSQIRHPKEAE